MSIIATIGLVGAWIATDDPHQLPFGTIKGSIDVAVGKIVDTRQGREVTVRDIARAAEQTRFVYLGESHDSASHHKMQAEVIDALVRRGRDVIVGFEMFTRPRQEDLNLWTMGWLNEADFITRSQWKTEWGFDYNLYKPIFDTIRMNKLPMIALNVPRDWVKTVARKGIDGLTDEQKGQLPKEIDLKWADHRKLFETMIGGHPMGGPSGDNMYAAQVLWDTGMADSVLKYWDRAPRNSRTVVVVIAGAGHLMYGLGINGRIAKRTGEKGITVTMVDAQGKATVSRGIGDFVYVSEASSKP